MTISADQLQPLQSLCDGVHVLPEGPYEYIHFMKLKVRVAGANHIVDAILCPAAHSGYTTRLFLSQSFPGRGANWSVHQILGRQWHTWSWQGVPASLPLPQMLLCHLDALK